MIIKIKYFLNIDKIVGVFKNHICDMQTTIPVTDCMSNNGTIYLKSISVYN